LGDESANLVGANRLAARGDLLKRSGGHLKVGVRQDRRGRGAHSQSGWGLSGGSCWDGSFAETLARGKPQHDSRSNSFPSASGNANGSCEPGGNAGRVTPESFLARKLLLAMFLSPRQHSARFGAYEHSGPSPSAIRRDRFERRPPRCIPRHRDVASRRGEPLRVGGVRLPPRREAGICRRGPGAPVTISRHPVP
jgi:hypothetical protein